MISIPYSGTRFLKKTFKISQNCHSFAEPPLLISYVGDRENIVVPLRRPEDNWKAWARRWPKHKPWDDRIAGFERSYLGMYWVLEYFKDRNIIIIPLDLLDNQATELERIARDNGLRYIPVEERVGETDEGDNWYDYDVKKVYRYNYIKQHYKRQNNE